MRRTVVLHPGALGDVLLSIPALRMLRRDEGEVVLAAQPRIGRLLESLGAVDRHVAFDTLGLDALFGEDAPPPPLHQLFAGARIVSWFGSGDAGFKRRLRALAPDTLVASSTPPAGATAWEHLFASVGARSTADDRDLDAIPVSPAIVDDGRRVLAAAGWDGVRPLLMLHPGAGGPTKRWPVEGFAEVAEALRDAFAVGLLVHEGPADHEPVTALRGRLRVPSLHLVDPPLEALAGAMRHARLWIGNDSGVTHLGAAVGTPALALFTAVNLAWRPWPRGASVHVVSMDAPSRTAVDAVVAKAAALLGARAPHPVGGRR
ncbi:MAG: glycosyltransferase family 9 protein [Gammaproteobacteria bacterium]